MEPLRGTNKATWCANDPLGLLWLFRTHCCCVSPCGWYNPPSASHPPPMPTPPPSRPRPPTPYNITAVGKNQQCQLVGRISYETIAIIIISGLLILEVWRDNTVALVNHSGFNISNWYFLKYKTCP